MMLVKPPAVTNVIMTKKILPRCNVSITASRDLSLFLSKCVDYNTKPRTFLF
jgi:hypothetical protein